MPAAVDQLLPGRVPGHAREKSEHLGVTGRSVTPPEAIPLDQLRLVLRVRVRDKKSRRAGLVAAHDIGGTGERQLAHLVPAARVADSGKGVDYAQRAVGDVVKPREDPASHLPVHASRGWLRRLQIRLHSQYRKIHIPGRECAECDPGVAAQQLELVAPPLAVEAGADDLEGTVRSHAGGRVSEHVVDRTQCNGHPGQTEVQGAVADTVNFGLS